MRVQAGRRTAKLVQKQVFVGRLPEALLGIRPTTPPWRPTFATPSGELGVGRLRPSLADDLTRTPSWPWADAPLAIRAESHPSIGRRFVACHTTTGNTRGDTRPPMNAKGTPARIL